MSAKGIKVILLLLSVLCAIGMDFNALSDDCLKNKILHETADLNCITSKNVKIQRIREGNQTFYCIKYEKKSGNRDEFDALTFDLHEDYDLKFVKTYLRSLLVFLIWFF